MQGHTPIPIITLAVSLLEIPLATSCCVVTTSIATKVIIDASALLDKLLADGRPHVVEDRESLKVQCVSELCALLGLASIILVKAGGRRCS